MNLKIGVAVVDSYTNAVHWVLWPESSNKRGYKGPGERAKTKWGGQAVGELNTGPAAKKKRVET